MHSLLVRKFSYGDFKQLLSAAREVLNQLITGRNQGHGSSKRPHTANYFNDPFSSVLEEQKDHLDQIAPHVNPELLESIVAIVAPKLRKPQTQVSQTYCP